MVQLSPLSAQPHEPSSPSRLFLLLRRDNAHQTFSADIALAAACRGLGNDTVFSDEAVASLGPRAQRLLVGSPRQSRLTPQCPGPNLCAGSKIWNPFWKRSVPQISGSGYQMGHQ